MKAPLRVLSLLLITLLAKSFAANPPDARTVMLQRLFDQMKVQAKESAEGEALHQSYTYNETRSSNKHDFLLRLKDGISVVVESHLEDDVYTQRDYYLKDSKVYAYHVARRDPLLEGKMMRVTESNFFFNEGTPVYRSVISGHVPSGEDNPDLRKAKAKELELPLPAGLEGWSDKLTARAFDIARTFRPGVGRFAFPDWDNWLLKKAPPDGSGDPPKRNESWLPPADTLILPVAESTSPDELYCIGWGYEKGPVDWKALACRSEGTVEFSTQLQDGPLAKELDGDKNFLLNAISGEPVRTIGNFHGGERQRFNHDGLITHWSPSDTCFVVIETAKWDTGAAMMGWMQDGRCDHLHDILDPLVKAAGAAVLKSKHPAAKRMRDEKLDSYSTMLSNILVEDDGSFEAVLSGGIPKDDLPSGYYQVIIEGVFSPAKKDDDSAVLKVKKTRVLPPENNN